MLLKKSDSLQESRTSRGSAEEHLNNKMCLATIQVDQKKDNFANRLGPVMLIWMSDLRTRF